MRTPLAFLGVLACCAMWLFQTSCNRGATFESCGSAGPGFLMVKPPIFAPGIEASVVLCLRGGPSLDLAIQQFTVRGDGIELGEVTSDGRCLTVPIETKEPTDATLRVQAEVDFDISVTCGTITYDTSSEIEVRVREPDEVLLFEPGACAARLCVLLAGSDVGFDYELGADGEPLSYGLDQPPLLVDTGELAPQDDGSFKLPDAPGVVTVRSQIAGDDFEWSLIVYELAEVVRAELELVNSNRENTVIGVVARAWLEYLPTIDTPPGTVIVEVVTPATCRILSDDEPDGATMAEIGFSTGIEVEIVDPEAGACVLEATYGDVTTSFSWPEP